MKLWITLCLSAALLAPVACATTSTCSLDADGVPLEECVEAHRALWQVIADLITASGDRAESELDEAGE